MFNRIIMAAFILTVATANRVEAQINKYQFVIVPEKFQEFQVENQHHTSTLLKALFSREGITTYYERQVPYELIGSCKGLKVDLLDESSMLRTRAILVLKDCKGKEIFRTTQGDSREKDLRVGFRDAIEAAFKSIEALNYKYEQDTTAQETDEPVTLNFHNDVKSLEESGDSAQSARNRAPDQAILQEASPEVQRYEDRSPKPSDYKSGAPEGSGKTESGEADPEVWYAQSLPNGFQLVDSSPEIRLTLLETSMPEIYLAENETTHGLVFKHQDRWCFEYYQDGEKMVQELHIKF